MLSNHHNSITLWKWCKHSHYLALVTGVNTILLSHWRQCIFVIDQLYEMKATPYSNNQLPLVIYTFNWICNYFLGMTSSLWYLLGCRLLNKHDPQSYFHLHVMRLIFTSSPAGLSWSAWPYFTMLPLLLRWKSYVIWPVLTTHCNMPLATLPHTAPAPLSYALSLCSSV